jgi:hypothetical protein
MKFLELPFASATFDPGIQFFVGRAGTIRLSTIAAMDCVATAGRWRTSDAEELENAYKLAGMTQLVQSPN